MPPMSGSGVLRKLEAERALEREIDAAIETLARRLTNPDREAVAV